MVQTTSSILFSKCDANEFDNYLQKFQTFKKDYLELKASFKTSREHNQLLLNQVRLLENKLKLHEENPILTNVIELQETILKYMRKKDNCTAMQDLYDTLQQKVQDLESDLKMEKNSILEMKSKEMMSLLHDNNMRENQKIRQLEADCRELSTKNDELNVVLQTFAMETENEMTGLKEKFNRETTVLKEAKIKLEAENKLLVEKFIHQEKLYKGSLQLLEKQNNVQNVTHKNKRKFMQTLEEAFESDKDILQGFQNPEVSKNLEQIFESCINSYDTRICFTKRAKNKKGCYCHHVLISSICELTSHRSNTLYSSMKTRYYQTERFSRSLCESVELDCEPVWHNCSTFNIPSFVKRNLRSFTKFTLGTGKLCSPLKYIIGRKSVRIRNSGNWLHSLQVNTNINL